LAVAAKPGSLTSFGMTNLKYWSERTWVIGDECVDWGFDGGGG
jgi:hypothetical protein